MLTSSDSKVAGIVRSRLTKVIAVVRGYPTSGAGWTTILGGNGLERIQLRTVREDPSMAPSGLPPADVSSTCVRCINDDTVKTVTYSAAPDDKQAKRNKPRVESNFYHVP